MPMINGDSDIETNIEIESGVTVTAIETRTRSRHESWKKATRAYVFIDDESMMENFGSRFDRPTKLFRKALVASFEELGLTAEMAGSIRWSQKAGCGCGCSPGFVLSGLTHGGRGEMWFRENAGWRNEPTDIYVSVRVNDAPAMTERGAARVAQLAAQL